MIITIIILYQEIFTFEHLIRAQLCASRNLGFNDLLNRCMRLYRAV